jgi:SanA protein
MIKRNLKRLIITLFFLGLMSLAAIFVLNQLTHSAYANRMYSSVADVPNDDQPRESSRRVAIVFGAGLERNGGPTPVLYDRVATAVELYKAGKVNKLLLTGDNRFINYNELAVMRQTALQLGVPDDALVLDYAGRRTYDSCYRARDIFGLNRAILVTQAFHLDRALYLCNSLGVDSLGVSADRRAYAASSMAWWSIREAAATVGAWFDLNVVRPLPVLGDNLPIGN